MRSLNTTSVLLCFACATFSGLGLCQESASGHDGAVKPEPRSQAVTSAPSAPAKTPVVVRPVLQSAVEPRYPEQAITAHIEGDVVLHLTIDAQGRVNESIVVREPGYGLGSAAQKASLLFRFIPARRGGQVTAAKIRYVQSFRLSAQERQLAPIQRRAKQEPNSATVAKLPPARTTAPDPLPAIGGAEAEPIEVTVQGQTVLASLRQSAQAVRVVDTEQPQRESADLGEVLSRSQGVGVRRSGGLGSGVQFSLNGLTNDQIRLFIDGIPLEFAGYPFGIGNVPVNLVDRVEIYRGVVPVRYGADALGGAVDLVTDHRTVGTHGSLSYQVGSFGTYRVTSSARHRHEPSGWFARVSGFADLADNDYPINVEVTNDVGRLSPARVHRFHDGYQALGANIETGVLDRSWARRLLVRAFVADYQKELQHNIVMTVPYGEAEYSRRSAGANLSYEQSFGENFIVEGVAGYAYGRTSFLDVADCVYNWFGRCGRERHVAGETDSQPSDQRIWQHSAFSRLHAEYLFLPDHSLRATVAPTYSARTGDERRQLDPDARDPLTAQRSLFTMVSGVEYQADLFDERLQNITFGKHYIQSARSKEPLPGDGLSDRQRDTHRIGVGDSLRYRFTDWLYAKASYEWATRLPRPDETFGDGVLIIDNLGLGPEVSHNVNVGASLDLKHRAGAFRAELDGFLRETDQLIVLLGNDRVFSYQNVYGARSQGVEAAAGYTTPGGYAALDGNVTYMDFRNTSAEGAFGAFKGDRIPNRPYLFANGTLRLQTTGVASAADQLSLSWYTRYVHEFFRGWESVGLFKQFVDSQLLHTVALGYLLKGSLTVSGTLEVQNITNQPAFDFIGVQRPGRATYFKMTTEF